MFKNVRLVTSFPTLIQASYRGTTDNFPWLVVEIPVGSMAVWAILATKQRCTQKCAWLERVKSGMGIPTVALLGPTKYVQAPPARFSLEYGHVLRTLRRELLENERLESGSPGLPRKRFRGEPQYCTSTVVSEWLLVTSRDGKPLSYLPLPNFLHQS